MDVWIGRDGERHGPYPESDIRQWLRSGEVSRDDLGWYEGLADWQPLAVLFPEATPAATPSSMPPTMPLRASGVRALEDYAGFWKRVAAYLLDGIILYIPSLLIERLFDGTAARASLQQALDRGAGDASVLLAAEHQYYLAMWPAIVLSGLMVWLYFALCESSAWQATIGKRALGIRVTDLHGQRISFPRALGRYLAKLLSAFLLCIGFLMVAWTQRKQGLHDLLANTLVLNGRAGAPVTPERSDERRSFHA